MVVEYIVVVPHHPGLADGRVYLPALGLVLYLGLAQDFLSGDHGARGDQKGHDIAFIECRDLSYQAIENRSYDSIVLIGHHIGSHLDDHEFFVHVQYSSPSSTARLKAAKAASLISSLTLLSCMESRAARVVPPLEATFSIQESGLRLDWLKSSTAPVKVWLTKTLETFLEKPICRAASIMLCMK